MDHEDGLVRVSYADALRLYIDFARLLVERDRRLYGDIMTIEIKGLGNSVQAARDAIRNARAATAKMQEAGTLLVTTADDIAKTFTKHTEDLLFEAQQLGNGEPPSVTPKADTAVQGNGTNVDAIRPRVAGSA